MQSYTTEGIIVKRTDSGEADRILFVLSHDRGLIKAIAKAARMPRSKLGGFLDLFSHAELTLSPGRTFDIITEARTVNSFTGLGTNVQHHLYASHIGELVMKAMHEGGDNSKQLFTLVRDTYYFLSTHTNSPFLLSSFRMKFLAQLGYAPNLSDCAHCHAPLTNRTNYLTDTYDSVLCGTCRELPDVAPFTVPLSPSVLKLLRLFGTGTYEVLASIKAPRDAVEETEHLTERFVQYHLGITLNSSVFIRMNKLSPQRKTSIEITQ